MKFHVIAVLAVASVMANLPQHAQAQDDPYTWRWYEVDQDNNLRVNLYVFWRSTCPHCPPALAYAEQMGKRHPWLKIRRYELTQYPSNLTLYQKMANKIGQPAGQTPAFFFCNQMMVGYLSDQQTGRKLEDNLVRCHEHLRKQWEEKQQAAAKESTAHWLWNANHVAIGSPRVPVLAVLNALSQAAPAVEGPIQAGAVAKGPIEDGPVADGEDVLSANADELNLDLDFDLELPPPAAEIDTEETVALPFGDVKASELSMPMLTLVIAGCDAFNPCAFFVLLSLLSLLINARSRWKIATVGGIFVICSGLFYFLFMAAWLNVFLIAGHLKTITIVAGVLAIVAAAINIKDYFWLKQGVSLSIPDSAKPGLFDRMRRLASATKLAPMLAGTLMLAAAANAYELMCTAGFPMVFTRILTLRDLPTSSYYGYLALYNVIYVIPLAVIVTVFTWTLGKRKLQEHEGRILKLASGVMMLMLGGTILLAPQLLQSMVAAVSIMGASIVLTTLIVLVDRWRRRGSAAVRKTTPAPRDSQLRSSPTPRESSTTAQKSVPASL